MTAPGLIGTPCAGTSLYGGVHPRARYCVSAERSPLRGTPFYAETSQILGDLGVFDARRSLLELEHPAGHRHEPVWAANHCRAIVDQAWNAMRKGIVPIERHVTPYLVARWLWNDEQFNALLDMALSMQDLTEEHAATQWLSWVDCLSPDASWKDGVDPHRESSSGDTFA